MDGTCTPNKPLNAVGKAGKILLFTVFCALLLTTISRLIATPGICQRVHRFFDVGFGMFAVGLCFEYPSSTHSLFTLGVTKRS